MLKKAVALRLHRYAPSVVWRPFVDQPLRMLQSRRRCRLRRGAVTVITVSYRSLRHLQVMVPAVRRFTDVPIDVMVIDNASRDGTGAWLRTQPEIRSVVLPYNVFHGRALDLGVLLSDTEFVVTLDVDAFPISRDWLSRVIDPLREGAHVAGAAYTDRRITYAHPCFLAMRKERFLDERHSFCEVRRRNRLILDTGESISQSEDQGVHLIEPTHVRGPGPIGTVYGDVLYHNFFGTRLERRPIFADLAGEADAAWEEAVDRYLPELSP